MVYFFKKHKKKNFSTGKPNIVNMPSMASLSSQSTFSVLFVVQLKPEDTSVDSSSTSMRDTLSSRHLYSMLLNVSCCVLKNTSSKYYIQSNEWEVSPTASFVRSLSSSERWPWTDPTLLFLILIWFLFLLEDDDDDDNVKSEHWKRHAKQQWCRHHIPRMIFITTTINVDTTNRSNTFEVTTMKIKENRKRPLTILAPCPRRSVIRSDI